MIGSMDFFNNRLGQLNQAYFGGRSMSNLFGSSMQDMVTAKMTSINNLIGSYQQMQPMQPLQNTQQLALNNNYINQQTGVLGAAYGGQATSVGSNMGNLFSPQVRNY